VLLFGVRFNQKFKILKNSLNNLRHLEFGYGYNSFDDISMLAYLTGGEGGCQFNNAIDDIIQLSKLEILKCGDAFNQDCSHIKFPNTIKIISFGILFTNNNNKKELNDIKWPEALTSISLYNFVNINIAWPCNLIKIELLNYFNQEIHNVIWPPLLEYLALGHMFKYHSKLNKWPATLTKLLFINNNLDINLINLPVSLEILQYSFTQGIISWPNTVHTLIIDPIYNAYRYSHNISWPPNLAYVHDYGFYGFKSIIPRINSLYRFYQYKQYNHRTFNIDDINNKDDLDVEGRIILYSRNTGKSTKGAIAC
jgi:hypothetical protein